MKAVAVRRVCIPVNSSVSAERQSAPAILVALTDPDLRAVSSRVLVGAGYRVLTARHSGHALLACLTGGRVDVLLTDLQMDDGSGPELVKRLRRHNPDLRAVYFSDDPADRADDVLVRPVTADAMVQAIDGRRAGGF